MGYIVAVRIATTIIGNVFVWAGSPFYSIYEHAQRPWGLSAAADQGIAGGVMMIEGSIVTIGALAWLFLRLAQEGELRQELLERGVDPRSVRRAVSMAVRVSFLEPSDSRSAARAARLGGVRFLHATRAEISEST